MRRVLARDLVAPLFKTFQLITLDNINRILDDLNLHCHHFSQVTNGDGVVNLVYFLSTKRLDDTDGPELVLRVMNCQPWWKDQKLQSEVAVMKFVKQKFPQIPVPTILKYCTNSETSPIGAEFMIMEKMPGVTSLKTEQKQEISKQIVKYVSDLMSVKFDVIGSFTSDMKPTVCIYDGPRLGPFKDSLSWCKAVLEFSLEELQTHPYLQEVRHEYEKPFQEILSKLDSFYKHSPENDEIVLCHNDLHPGNILVDPETLQVTAVFDWEQAKAYPWHVQWTHARLFWEDESEPEENLPQFMDELLFMNTGKKFESSPNDFIDVEDEETTVDFLDALLVDDIRAQADGLLLWNICSYVQEYLIKGEDTLEDLEKRAEEGIKEEIQQNAEYFAKLSKVLLRSFK